MITTASVAKSDGSVVERVFNTDPAIPDPDYIDTHRDPMDRLDRHDLVNVDGLGVEQFTNHSSNSLADLTIVRGPDWVVEQTTADFDDGSRLLVDDYGDNGATHLRYTDAGTGRGYDVDLGFNSLGKRAMSGSGADALIGGNGNDFLFGANLRSEGRTLHFCNNASRTPFEAVNRVDAAAA